MTPDSHELFTAVFEQLPDGLIIVNANDEIAFVNRAAEEIRRTSANEVVGHKLVSCHPEKSRDKVKRALQYLRSRETNTYARMVVDHEKGRYYENNYTPVRDRLNNYIGAIVISRDITDRRRLEEEKARHLQDVTEKVSELDQKLRTLYLSALSSLVNTLEAKDPYTKGHSLRVCEISVKMAEHVYGVSPESSEIELAGKLHDIGKVGIRDTILNKPGRLTEEEFNHIKEHPIIAENILMPVEKLRPVTKVIRHHHERFDGGGYPDGLAGEEIPAGSRIIALADGYDAMTTARPYRPPMPVEDAAKQIQKGLGSQFDPRLGEVFLELIYSGAIG